VARGTPNRALSVLVLKSSEVLSSDAQGNHFAFTVASKSQNGHGGDHKEKLEPDPSNQVGPTYASKVHRDHGARGQLGDVHSI